MKHASVNSRSCVDPTTLALGLGTFALVNGTLAET